MWFKGQFFLCYTALLVAPTIAAFHGRDGDVGKEHLFAARSEQRPRLPRRQQPWTNATRTSTYQEPENVVTDSSTSAVEVSTFDAVRSTPTPEQHSDETSTIVEPADPTSFISDAVQRPGQSSRITTSTDVRSSHHDQDERPKTTSIARPSSTSDYEDTKSLIATSLDTAPTSEPSSNVGPPVTRVATSTSTAKLPHSVSDQPLPTPSLDLPSTSPLLPTSTHVEQVPESTRNHQTTATAITTLDEESSAVQSVLNPSFAHVALSSSIDETSTFTTASTTRTERLPSSIINDPAPDTTLIAAPTLRPSSTGYSHISHIARPSIRSSVSAPTQGESSVPILDSPVPGPTSFRNPLVESSFPGTGSTSNLVEPSILSPEETPSPTLRIPTSESTKFHASQSEAQSAPRVTQAPSSISRAQPTEFGPSSDAENVRSSVISQSVESPLGPSSFISSTEDVKLSTQPTSTGNSDDPVGSIGSTTVSIQLPTSTVSDVDVNLSFLVSQGLQIPSVVSSVISSVHSEVHAIPSIVNSVVSSVHSEAHAIPSIVNSVVSSIQSEVHAIPSIVNSIMSSAHSEVHAIPSVVSSVVSSAQSEAQVIPTAVDSAISSMMSDIQQISNGVSSIVSSVHSDAQVVPTPIDSTVHSFPSDIKTALVPSTQDAQSSQTVLPVNPTSISSRVSSVLSDVLSTGISIPVSETPLSTIPLLPTAERSSTVDGISLPRDSGTGFLPMPTEVSSALPSSGFNTHSDPTGPIVSEPTAPPKPTATGSPQFPDFSLFDSSAVPTAGSDKSSGLASSQITQQIPASETIAKPTPTGVATTPLSVLPEPGSTAAISGSTNASLIATSGSSGPVTSGAIPISTRTSPVTIDTLETSSRPDAPKQTSESKFLSQSTGSKDDKSHSETPSSTGYSSNQSGLTTQTSLYSSTIPGDYGTSATSEPSASSTDNAATGGGSGDEKPPPLTKSQTAGIAIGGTTCLLIALVAALFLARRYHQNAGKRESTESVYPKVAYLYDPPVGGNDDAEAGGAVPAMSGGAGGYAALPSNPSRHSLPSNGNAPRNSPQLPRESNYSRYSTGMLQAQGPSQVPLPINAAATVAAAAAAGKAISEHPYAAEASQNPFRDPIIPSPQPSPRLSGYGGPMGDARGEYATLAVNPYAFNPAASEYPPMSPYGPPPAVVAAVAATNSRSGTPVKARASDRYSDPDPFADPFEHDLLLNVDSQTETPNSIVVLAPPPTPRSPHAGRYTPSPDNHWHHPPPTPCATHFPGRDSSSRLSIIPGRYMPDHLAPMGRGTSDGRLSPISSSAHSSLATPIGRDSPESNSSAASSHTTMPRSPIALPPRAASPPPITRGWDDIRMDDPVPVPAPLFVKKPLLQRREPTLSGPGQLLLSGAGLPLTVKRKPMGSGNGSGNLEVPRSLYGSPGPTVTEFSDDPVVQRKRSGELLFADPHLIGRNF